MVNKISNEEELCLFLENNVKDDFLIFKEVSGTHLIENIGVKIDYILYPKNHLVLLGFPLAYFGVEVKYIELKHSFEKHVAMAFAQSVSYKDSRFNLENKLIKLNFVLLLSNLAFIDDRKSSREIYSDGCSHSTIYTHYCNFASYLSVGYVRFSFNELLTYSFHFSNMPYFKKTIKEDNVVEYSKVNTNLISKLNIGNCHYKRYK